MKAIDHIALVVEDMDEAIGLYEETLQAQFYLRETNEEQGFEVAAFAVGDAHIELLSPTRPDSVIGGFLRKRGPGIHHVALEVEGIAERVRQLRVQGLQFTSDAIQCGTGGSQIAFIHPKSLLGTMIELVEPPGDGKARHSAGPAEASAAGGPA